MQAEDAATRAAPAAGAGYRVVCAAEFETKLFAKPLMRLKIRTSILDVEQGRATPSSRSKRRPSGLETAILAPTLHENGSRTEVENAFLAR